MAATVSAWAKPGAWALDSEEHEEELLQQQKEETDDRNNQFKARDGSSLGRETAGLSDFPTLASAASNKTKKKKGQTFSLAEFSGYGPAKTAQTIQAKGLTNEELTRLPTGPRQRTEEELDRSRLGGGFRSYGSNDRNSRYSNGDESSNSRWGSSRVSDEPRRTGSFGKDANGEFVPSRADEIDDWGAAKKSSVGGGFERRDRGERGGFFDSQSRADESDNWVSNKSFVPSEGRRFGSTGGGFEVIRERRGGFESNGSGGADSDNWGKKKEDEGRRFGAAGGAFESLRERRGGYELATNGGGGADSDSWGKKREEGSGSGIGSGRPRLNLQPRRVPVGDEQQNGMVTVKPKGSNPFGDARPREEVLKEKGQDWKEVDEKLELMKIKDVGSAGTGPTEGPSFGKRSFSGNGRASFLEDRSDRSWRKTDSVDVCQSAEKTENGVAVEAEDREP